MVILGSFSLASSLLRRGGLPWHIGGNARERGGFNLALTLPSFFPNPYRKLTVNIGRTLVVILWSFLPWFFPGSAVAFPLRYGCCSVADP